MESVILSSNGFFRQAPTTASLSEWLPAAVKKSSKPPQNATPPNPSLQSDLAISTDENLKRNESARPKQSKSRSGCMTCKKKRIKCDEAKPTCGQCQRRNLECDGYKLNYKWRSFDDTIKPPPGAGKTSKKSNRTAQGAVSTHGQVQLPALPTPSNLEGEISWSPPLHPTYTYSAPTSTECLPLPTEDNPSNHPEDLNHSQLDLLSDLESGFYNSDVELMPVLPISPSQSSGSYDRVSNEEAIRRWAVSAAPEPGSPYSGVRASPPDYFQSNPLAALQSTHVSPFHAVYLDHASPEMLLLRFDRETCAILSIKDGFSENPWRTFVRPLAKDSNALYHAISAMAAFHGAATQPRLRLIGMTHMTEAISTLSAEMHKMSENQILASALALCIGEGWDDKISTGIKHLKGAKTVLNNALTRTSRSLKLGQLSREEVEPLKFLSNTFVYLDAIARLTSSEDHDNINLDNAVQAMNEPIDSGEIDPLMGCATALFPLLGKVASLIHRIRKTSSNSLSIIGEANELREELLHWEPPDMYSFEQPNDPSSNVRHVLQTAEAYRRAILLHLHSAVAELSSEPSHDQAKATLAMLAATPISSRTVIVQIFPLLVGSCEMVQPDDRQWVAQRWEAMMKRLTLVNVSSCWKIVKEVWRRRDQWIETQPQQMRPRVISRSLSPRSLPSRSKPRNSPEANSANDEVMVGSFQERDGPVRGCSGPDRDRSPTFDTSRSQAPRRGLVRLPRNHTDMSLLSGAVEYTVRGQLHWLGVMSDWNWEVFL